MVIVIWAVVNYEKYKKTNWLWTFDNNGYWMVWYDFPPWWVDWCFLYTWGFVGYFCISHVDAFNCLVVIFLSHG